MSASITYHRLSAENMARLDAADVFDNPVDPDQLAAFIATTGHELVFALQEEKVVGFASGQMLLHPDKPPSFFVAEVGVNEDMRRQEIATTLLNRLFAIANASGSKGIWLATETDNTAARALYRSFQARETEAVVVYDWDGAMDVTDA